MERLTMVGLIDKCINGDETKLGLLFGSMFDPMNCFYSILRDSRIPNAPKGVIFTTEDKAAVFEIADDVHIADASKIKSEKTFGYEVSVQKANNTTKVRVQTG